MSAKNIRVLIVDDHPMVAEGIQSILESYDDIEVMGTLTNGRQAIDQIDFFALKRPFLRYFTQMYRATQMQPAAP